MHCRSFISPSLAAAAGEGAGVHGVTVMGPVYFLSDLNCLLKASKVVAAVPLGEQFAAMVSSGAAITLSDSKIKSSNLSLLITHTRAPERVSNWATPRSKSALAPSSVTAIKADSTKPHSLSKVTATRMGTTSFSVKKVCNTNQAATPNTARTVMVCNKETTGCLRLEDLVMAVWFAIGEPAIVPHPGGRTATGKP